MPNLKATKATQLNESIPIFLTKKLPDKLNSFKVPIVPNNASTSIVSNKTVKDAEEDDETFPNFTESNLDLNKTLSEHNVNKTQRVSIIIIN